MALRLCPLTTFIAYLLAAGDFAGMSSAHSQTTTNLHGAGSSFSAEVYKSWVASYKAYRQSFVAVNMTYQIVGSSTGKSWIKDKESGLQYAGSDSPLSVEEQDSHPDLMMFPTVAGAIIIGFNLPGISSLNVSREVVVGMYNGTYTKWDDAALASLNPALTLPAEDIHVIARSDKSGTTRMFTEALCAFSPEWTTRFGAFSEGLDSSHLLPLKWNGSVVDSFGKSNRGVAGMILSHPHSLGYLSASEAFEADLPFADFVSPSTGTLTSANTRSVHNALDAVEVDNSRSYFNLSSAYQAGDDSYPMVGYSYFITYRTSLSNCEEAVELYRYVEWFLYDDLPRRICESVHMVPLSRKVADEVFLVALSRLQCAGQSVKTMSHEQKERESILLQTWRTPVYATVAAITFCLLLSLTYIIAHQMKLNRSLIRNEWRIPIENIKLMMVKVLAQNYMSMSSKSIEVTSLTEMVVTPDGPGRADRWAAGPVNVGRIFDFADGEDADLLFTKIQGLELHHMRLKAKKRLLWMRDNILNAHVVKFWGVTELRHTAYFLSSFCEKGSLYDVLRSDRYKLDNNFKFSMSCDIAAGMVYLHRVGIVHGNLKSASCYTDDRWNVKIGDWQYCHLAAAQGNAAISTKPLDLEPGLEHDENIRAREAFWTAPELVTNPGRLATKECDVFSLTMLLIEIFTRDDPYSELTFYRQAVDVLQDIIHLQLRPALLKVFPQQLQSLVRSAWSDSPAERPTVRKMQALLNHARPSQKSTLTCMMIAIEGYINTLEEKVAERTLALKSAMQEVEDLLHQILPPSIADKLRQGDPVPPELFESVTIFFSDIIGFTSLAAESTPMEVVNLLNDLYTVFDEAIDKHDVYKVETIGDAYMVISGLPNRNGIQHAAEIAAMAIDLAISSEHYTIPHRPEHKLELRVGIHTGPVCAGVVGLKMPRYALFGDTVNTASRMESTSIANKIHMSNDTQVLLRQIGGFVMVERGLIQVKGKGKMRTFWLHGTSDLARPMPEVFLRGATLKHAIPSVQ